MKHSAARALWRQPLIRLLAINLVGGFAAALLMLGGLLLLNPGHLRELIFADRMSYAALGLLLFGLVVTFGSVAMGSAVMMLGKVPKKGGGGGKREIIEARVRAHS